MTIENLYLEERLSIDEIERKRRLDGLRARERIGITPVELPAPATPPSETEKPGLVSRVISDVAKGLEEAPKQILGGARDAIDQAGKAVEAAGNYLRDKTFLGDLEKTLGIGKVSVKLPEVDKGQSKTGDLLRSTAQFLTGFIPGMKLARGAGIANTVIQGLAAGAVTDATVFDPKQPRVSNLINDLAPALKNPVTDYLAASPDDSEAEGRFKNALEGLALGGVMDGFFATVKAIRGNKLASVAKEASVGRGETKVSQAVDVGLERKAGKETGPGIATAGESIADVEPRVNLTYIDAEQRVKNIIETVNKQSVASGAIEKQVRGKITHEQTIAASQKMPVEEALAIQPGTVLNNEKMLAIRDLRDSAGATVQDLMDKTLAGDKEAGQHLQAAMDLLGQIELRRAGVSAEVARSLESHKIPSVGARADFDYKSVGEMAQGLTGTPIDPVVLAKRLRTLTSDQLVVASKQLAASGKWDVFLEAWINGLLSSPSTHAANFIGNISALAESIVERGVAGSIGRGVESGEAVRMVYGAVSGFMDAVHLAGKTLREGHATQSKFDAAFKPAITGETFHATGVLGRAIDMVGAFTRLPGRMLMASDEFFRGINYRMELHAQALRMAKAEGVEGAQLSIRIAEIIDNPPSKIVKMAQDFATVQTFQNELGDLGKSIQAFGNAHPLTKLILPFTKTPANLTKYAFERTPLAMLSQRIRKEISAGGAIRDLALAKIATGSTVLATAATLAAAGYITGGGPKDKNLRKQMIDDGWQPYSIKVGDKYYSFNRLDPVGMVLGFAASYSEIVSQLDEPDAGKLAMAGALAISDSVTSKTYLSGLASALDAMRDPEQPYVKNWLKSLVPSVVGQAEKIHDPIVREAWSVMDGLKARIPGFSDTLPPKRDLWGNPVAVDSGFILPVTVSQRKNDPVNLEMIRNEISIGMPTKYVAGRKPGGGLLAEDRADNGVPLTPQEWDRYIQLAGNEYKDPGTKLGAHDRLLQLIESPQYKASSDGPDGGKAVMIRTVINAYRGAALEQLKVEYPELGDQIRNKMKGKAEALKNSSGGNSNLLFQ